MRHILSFSAITALLFSMTANAKLLDFWADDGWTQVASEDYVSPKGRVYPGWGGQDFDAEYLFYRLDGNTLSLGLQTGFDLIDGHVHHSDGLDYYAGDLAIGFNSSQYNYAVDFGLETQSYGKKRKRYDPKAIHSSAGSNGVDPAGLYAVSQWNKDIYYRRQSSPFAMDEGTLVSSLLSNDVGLVGDSYFRTVSFNLNPLALGSTFDMDLHWTMSCGNDAIDASVSIEATAVPEPNPIYLLVLGLLALAAARINANKSLQISNTK